MINQTSSDSIAFTLQKILLETEKESYSLGENNCKLCYLAEDLKIHKTQQKETNYLEMVLKASQENCVDYGGVSSLCFPKRKTLWSQEGCCDCREDPSHLWSTCHLSKKMS